MTVENTGIGVSGSFQSQVRDVVDHVIIKVVVSWLGIRAQSCVTLCQLFVRLDNVFEHASGQLQDVQGLFFAR